MWLYCLVWFLSLSLTNWLFLWMSMEVLNWIFLSWITSSLMFLMWQGIASLSLLYFWFLNFSPMMIILVLTAKMGLPPFASWAWTSAKKWNFQTWVLFLSLHKTLPLALLMNFFLLEAWLLFWPLLSILMLYYFYSLKSLIFISSIGDASWLLSSSWISTGFFWYYIILYSFIWWTVSFVEKMNLNLFLLILLALPPSIFFFFKSLVWLVSPLLFSMVLSVFSLLVFVVYWAYFSSMCFFQFFNYFKKKYWKWTTLLMSSQILIFAVL